MADEGKSTVAAQEPRIIVALDLPSAREALAVAKQLEPTVCRLKVGKELFVASGPTLVADLVALGFDVFLDLKFHDIPNTVASACRTAADLGVWMIDLHIAGGPSMIDAAKEAITASSHSPLLVGVTVLTSIDVTELSALGIEGEPFDWVLRWSQIAASHGLDGVVCSAREAAQLRQRFADTLLLVTPGIRPEGTASNDQRRVVSPREAVRLGADYLVIGRPVTGAANPYGVVLAIQSEICHG